MSHMKWLRHAIISIVAFSALAFAGAALAAPPTPPFTQCPPVGLDTSCRDLIVINSEGNLEAFSDPTQPPYDGIEDTLIGVQNNSSKTVTKLELASTEEAIFGFDGDGLCTTFNKPAGCPFGPTGYEGPKTSFTVTNAFEGTVNFLEGTIAKGGSAYFSLEGDVTCTTVSGKLKCGSKPKHPTETTVKCEPPTVVAGQPTTCTATVTDTSESEPTTPTGSVSFGSSGKGSFSPTSCELKTASSSSATCSVTYTPGSTPSEPVRKDTITATYGGDETHEGSEGTTTVTVISPTALAHGSFVIGDKNAVIGKSVTFYDVEWWGSEWWKRNSLSGGRAPSAFKGFAESSPSPPTCGETWTTDTGNSSGPPATVPEYMEVIGASRITQSGSTVTGNAPKVAVVKTNPGYLPDPGHRGTGKVVAIVCES